MTSSHGRTDRPTFIFALRVCKFPWYKNCELETSAGKLQQFVYDSDLLRT